MLLPAALRKGTRSLVVKALVEFHVGKHFLAGFGKHACGVESLESIDYGKAASALMETTSMPRYVADIEWLISSRCRGVHIVRSYVRAKVSIGATGIFLYEGHDGVLVSGTAVLC